MPGTDFLTFGGPAENNQENKNKRSNKTSQTYDCHHPAIQIQTRVLSENNLRRAQVVIRHIHKTMYSDCKKKHL